VKAANPDVLLAMAFPNDAIGVLRQLKQSNYAPKMFYEAVGASDPRFVESAGKDVDGVFSGDGLGSRRADAGERELSKASYRAEFKREPDYHSASNYSSLEVLAAALKRAGSLDREKLRDAIAAVSPRTLIGTWRVDPRTGIQLGYTSYILQWQNGKQVIVYPGNVRTRQAARSVPRLVVRGSVVTETSTVTEEVIASVSRCDDARLRLVFESLVRHLHAFADEVALTPAEWLAGVQFLTATGHKCDAVPAGVHAAVRHARRHLAGRRNRAPHESRRDRVVRVGTVLQRKPAGDRAG